MGDSSRTRPLAIVADLLVLGIVAGLLVALHVFVPGDLQDQFAFHQSLARPETLVTSAYLHLDDAHLFGNLVGYAGVALYTYVLCVAVGERRWFWLTTLSMLVVVPILVNVTSMVLWETVNGDVEIPATRGFSGIVAGFGGFLAIALLVSLRTAYSRRTVQYVGQFVLLVVLGELLLIYAGPFPTAGIGLIAGSIAMLVVGIARHGHPAATPANWEELASLFAGVLQVGFVLLVLATLVYGLFPVDLVEDGSMTDVFSHLSGLAWGVVVSRWGYRYWRNPAKLARI